MVLREQTYINAAGESYNITAFKYYISNFGLINTAGEEQLLPPEYYLVNEDSAQSKTITLQQLPAGHYQGISFLVGVDSVRNVSGAQTGALDPVNGMFWTWNSGYIMAKLEGTSPVSTAPANLIQYHIGGFKGAYNALRRVTLTFPQALELAADSEAALHLQADAEAWFQPNAVSFASLPAIHTPGAQAAAIADNYKNMFSIIAD
ncbi:hypothetical protein GCM10009415_25280 [Chitinophaga japonensis]